MPCPKKKKKGNPKKKHRKHTPIVSKKQRSAMGVAYAAKKGEISPAKLRGPAKQMYKSMSTAELKRHLKESKGKRLPRKVAKKERKSRKIIGSAYKFQGAEQIRQEAIARTEQIRQKAIARTEKATARVGQVRQEAITRAERIRQKAIARGAPMGFIPFDSREPRTGKIRKPEIGIPPIPPGKRERGVALKRRIREKISLL